MPDVFLSYSREDQAVARRFAERIEREGFSVWWDQTLSPGDAFDQVTEQALGEAHAVIVLWSKASVSSRWVRAEATQANAARRLLPVMIEPCTRPIMFELTHTADLSEWKGNADDPAWQSFVAGVRRFVQRRAPGDAAQVPALLTQPAGPPRGRVLLASVAAALAGAAAGLRAFFRRFGAGLAFALAGAAVAIAGVLAWNQRPPVAPDITRFTIQLEGTPTSNVLALSPDGRRIVYSLDNQLHSRRLDQDEPTPIPGTEGGRDPFFSPDGRSVAFFTLNQLKAFDFGGEGSRVLADFGQPPPGLVGAWDRRGRIFFGRGGTTGLYRVAAVGGLAESFAELADYRDMDYPDVLPGGDWVLFTALGAASQGVGTWSGADIVAQNVATGERKVVLQGGHFARYLPTGHLVFVRGGTLYAVAFDAKRLQTRGSIVPVVQGVATNEASGHAVFAVSANGTLIYAPGRSVAGPSTTAAVVRVGHDGRPTVLSAVPRDYRNLRISPDGSRIAVEVANGEVEARIWVMDTATGAATQLTFDGDENRLPVWTADGREIIYTSRQGKEYSLWRKAADGSGEARHVLDGADTLAATHVHDNTLIFQNAGEGGARDILALDLDAEGPPRPLLATAADESSAHVSPDGKWLVYVSIPPGPDQNAVRVYVRPYPNPAAGGQRAISEGPGVGPSWSATGEEIHYVAVEDANPGMLMSVPVTREPTTITPTGRRQLFPFMSRFGWRPVETSRRYASPYDVWPKDGDFIAVDATAAAPPPGGATPGASTGPRINVVLNWFEELKRLVPVEGS